MLKSISCDIFNEQNKTIFMHSGLNTVLGTDDGKVPCYILVLPSSFTDAELLYSTVKELYVSSNKSLFFPNDFNKNEIVIGNFDTTKNAGLCVATNAITRQAFISLANDIIKRLNIQNAYIKDGFSQKIGWLTQSDEDPNSICSKKDLIKWFDVVQFHLYNIQNEANQARRVPPSGDRVPGLWREAHVLVFHLGAGSTGMFSASKFTELNINIE